MTNLQVYPTGTTSMCAKWQIHPGRIDASFEYEVYAEYPTSYHKVGATPDRHVCLHGLQPGPMDTFVVGVNGSPGYRTVNAGTT